MNLDAEIFLSSLLFGAALGVLVWSGEDSIRRGIDFVERDFRDKLRRLRINSKRLRPWLTGWAMVAVLTFLVLWTVFGMFFLGLTAAAVMLALPWYVVRRLAERRRLQIEDQLADAMVSLSSGIKAGLSLAQSLEILAQQSPHPIRQEFLQIVGEYQMGKTLEKCLAETRARLRSENFALFAAAMEASRESGGRLNETVERIAISVREMQRLERKILAETSQARTSALYMALVPFGILALYYFVVDPVNTERLFTTVLGQLFLCTALVLNLAAYLWARAILSTEI